VRFFERSDILQFLNECEIEAKKKNNAGHPKDQLRRRRKFWPFVPHVPLLLGAGS
jgi:hypothetical protein